MILMRTKEGELLLVPNYERNYKEHKDSKVVKEINVPTGIQRVPYEVRTLDQHIEYQARILKDRLAEVEFRKINLALLKGLEAESKKL